MPFYDLLCKNGHVYEVAMSFQEYDNGTFGKCGRCAKPLYASAANRVCVYGTDKFSDRCFADASEASGETITNTKQVDALEKAGKMYAVTNPSRYQHKNGKKR